MGYVRQNLKGYGIFEISFRDMAFGITRKQDILTKLIEIWDIGILPLELPETYW